MGGEHRLTRERERGLGRKHLGSNAVKGKCGCGVGAGALDNVGDGEGLKAIEEFTGGELALFAQDEECETGDVRTCSGPKEYG